MVRPNQAEEAVALLEAGVKAAEAYGRPELGARVADVRDRLLAPDVHALVVGEFKQGKSTLINALLDVSVCPVDDDVATVIPTLLRHGVEASASVEHLPGPAADEGEEPLAAAEPTPIGLREVIQYASESGNPGNQRGVRSIEVRVPRQLLESGLTIIDTPGVGGLESIHGVATAVALKSAEVVIFVSDASSELSATELQFVTDAAKNCANVVCVLTKTDLYPDWRRIAELDRGHLKNAGLDIELLPVSSLLRMQATQTGDAELNAESGYPPLVDLIRRSVIGPAGRAALRSAMAELLHVLGQLERTFGAELEILDDPGRMAELTRELEEAQARAERLRSNAARWQHTLNDGSQDLVGDIDHDLRARLRGLSSAADDHLDDCDPIDIWTEYAEWLKRQVAAHVGANFEYVSERAADLADRVGQQFAIDEGGVQHDVALAVPAVVFPELAHLELERQTKTGNLLAAMRGSYGGILMFGMMGSIAGMTMLNPLTAVVGVGLGRRALKDEKKRSLTLRRQLAKQAVRKYVDEVLFTVGKDSRDFVRRVQRDLRDEFAVRAEEAQRSVRDALVAAEGASREHVSTRQARRQDVAAEIERIVGVSDRARALVDALAEEAS